MVIIEVRIHEIKSLVDSLVLIENLSQTIFLQLVTKDSELVLISFLSVSNLGINVVDSKLVKLYVSIFRHLIFDFELANLTSFRHGGKNLPGQLRVQVLFNILSKFRITSHDRNVAV